MESVDLDGSHFSMADITISGTQFADGAELATGQTERVIRQNALSSTVPILILDTVDESLNVNGSRTTLLARSIIALQATTGFTNGFLDCH